MVEVILLVLAVVVLAVVAYGYIQYRQAKKTVQTGVRIGRKAYKFYKENR